MKKELIQNTNLKQLLNATETALAAGTSSTLWIERTEFLSAVIGLATGLAIGNPTAYTVTLTVQDAEDISGTDAANLTDADGDTITIELTADNASSIADIDLGGARAFVGGSIVVAITGGNTVAGVAATGTLTFSGVVADTQTVTIGGDTYEFDTTGAVTEGNILVDVSGGATASAAVTALVGAITSDGDGTYGAADGAGDTVVVTFGTTGTRGNAVATTETCANGSWAATALTGGVDASPAVPINSYVALGDPRDTRNI